MYDLLVGEMAGQTGRLDLAVEHYLAAMRASDDSVIAERALRIALFAGRQQDALDAVLRWAELAPNNAEALKTAGLLLVRARRVDEGARYIDAALEAEGGATEDGFTALGWALQQVPEDEREAALEVAQILADRHPGVAAAHLVHARIAAQAQSYPEALEATDRALAIDPSQRDARLLRLRVLAVSGEIDGALTEISRMLEAAPQDADLRLMRARLYLQAKRMDEARGDYERLVAQRPQDGDLILMLALLNLEVRKYDEAAQLMQRLVRLGERVDDAHYYLGRIAREAGRSDEALAEFVLVQGGENYAAARLLSAEILARSGRIEAARAQLRDLRAGADDEGDILNAWLTEAELLSREAKAPAESMGILSRALLEFPGESRLLYARSLVAERLGRIDLAERDLRAILAVSPDDPQALNALGYTLADHTDRYDEAYDLIRRALEQRPDEPPILDSMGWVLHRLGRHDEAEPYLRRAYELMPDPEIASNLASLLWALGKREEALALIESELKAHPNHERLLRTRTRLLGRD